MQFSARHSLPLLAAAILPFTMSAARADPAELAARISAAVTHSDTAGDFVYALSPSFDGCTLTLVETETEAGKPDLALRETTITIDLARLAEGGVSASPDSTFVTIAMQAGALVGYVDSYAYGRVDRLDEPEKTLDIAADAGVTAGLVAALGDLARDCRVGGGTVLAEGTGTGSGGGWGGGSGDDKDGARRVPGRTTWGSGGTDPAATPAAEDPLAGDAPAWDAARAGDSVTAYRSYLDAYPDGEHVLEALRRIAALSAGSGGTADPVPTPPPASTGGGDGGIADELELWQAARRSDALTDYQNYLDLYPEGEFAILAERLIAELQGGGTTGGGSAGGDTTGGGSTGGGTAGGEDELTLWRRARLSDAPADYQAYLDAFPNGEFAEVARNRLADLGVAPGGGSGGGGGGTALASEDDLWRTAIFSDAPDDYQAYLDVYPDGTYAQTARNRLEQLGIVPDGGGGSGGGAVAPEPDMWRTAIFSDAAEDYQAYLRAYPDGPNAETARNRLEQLGIVPDGGGGGVAPDTSEPDLWRRAIFSDDPDDYQAYLRAYPDGPNAETARSRLRALGIEPQAFLTEPGTTRGIALGGGSSGEPTDDSDIGGVTPGVAAILSGDTVSAEAAEDALALGRADRREMQRRLKLMGHDPGPVDGLIGPRTREALRGWQREGGFGVTGYLDADQKRALWAASDTVYTAWLETRRRPDPPPAIFGAKPAPVGAPAVRRGADGCSRNASGSIAPGVSARCDAIGAMEGIGAILGN